MTTQIDQKAEDIICNHAWFSAIPGFMPIFILDIIGITAIQVDMVKQLAAHYDKPYSQQKGKAIVTSLTGSIVARIPGYSVRAAFKSIPVVGWILGGLSLSAFAAASTYAVGQVFKEHLAQGGTLNNLDPESFKKFYAQQFEKGRQFFQTKKQEATSSDEEE